LLWLNGAEREWGEDGMRLLTDMGHLEEVKRTAFVKLTDRGLAS
jgi:hypothetical protein